VVQQSTTKLTLVTLGNPVVSFFEIDFRSYVCVDIIHRILTYYFGLDVFHVMGITDVDEKIIVKANLEEKPISSITNYYESEFLKEMNQLNVISKLLIADSAGSISKCNYESD
jgi:cysteinyl-tRNA synthetase